MEEKGKHLSRKSENGRIIKTPKFVTPKFVIPKETPKEKPKTKE